MDMTSVARGRRARVNVTASRLELRLRSRPLAPALIALPETQRGTAFDADLAAQLPVSVATLISSLAIGRRPWIWCRIPARELCAFATSSARGPVCALGF